MDGVDALLYEPDGDPADLLDDQRMRPGASGRSAAAFWGVSTCSRDGGSSPSWQTPASPARRGDASRARNGSRYGRGRTRSWRSRSCPRCPPAVFHRLCGWNLDGLRPAVPLDRDQPVDAGPGWAPCGEERTCTVSDIAPDQHAACPQAGTLAAELISLEVSQFEIRPALRQIERAVDEGMAMPRCVGREHTDLAVGDLARRPRVFAAPPRRTPCPP